VTLAPFFIPSVIFLVLSLPLVFNLIPPNRGYGVRTAKTLSDPSIWYPVNRLAGLLLVISSSIYLSLAANWTPSKDFSVFLVHLATFGIPLLITGVSVSIYQRRFKA
jgi:uncharacterized membrane protein